MFHGRLLTPEWQEIRFSEWMNEEAIREFERMKGLDTPQNRFDKGVSFAKHALRIERMTRSIRGQAAVRVLDFGCGWGEFLVASKLVGFEAYGIERAPDRQRFLSHRGVTVFPDLGAAVEAVGRSYHAATLFQVLEHLEDPLEVLNALHDAMVPGAILVIEVPNCEGIEGIRDQSDYYNIHPLEHINCFTPKSLRNLANRAGFRAETPVIAHVTTSPLSVLKGEAKRWVQKLRSPNTNQYFRRP
jgi:2-polyprenyl-3-methyl-5-hydroxy-6-metoxy-1,4-benzoquinol methylase